MNTYLEMVAPKAKEIGGKMNEDKYQKPKAPEEQESILHAVALAQAVAYVTHRLIPKNDLAAADVPFILSIARDFLDWLRIDDLPVPTLAQKAVLDEIIKQIRSGGDDKKIFMAVLDWAEKTIGKRIYSQASAERFVKFYEETK